MFANSKCFCSSPRLAADERKPRDIGTRGGEHAMMRRVELPGTGIETSCLGFGCASLGSRVSARQGLFALARAHEAGVSWFDIAPAYGAGEAEAIFSRFLAGRRERLSILTKVGLAPPRRSALLRAAYAVGRPLLGVARDLRKRS